jgi:hypothetical protein
MNEDMNSTSFISSTSSSSYSHLYSLVQTILTSTLNTASCLAISFHLPLTSSTTSTTWSHFRHQLDPHSTGTTLPHRQPFRALLIRPIRQPHPPLPPLQARLSGHTSPCLPVSCLPRSLPACSPLSSPSRTSSTRAHPQRYSLHSSATLCSRHAPVWLPAQRRCKHFRGIWRCRPTRRWSGLLRLVYWRLDRF